MLKIAAVIPLLLEILLIKEATFQEENALFMTSYIPIKNTTYIYSIWFSPDWFLNKENSTINNTLGGMLVQK